MNIRSRIFISIFVLISCLSLIIYAKSNLTPKTVYVSGYTRKDGTRVSSYYRRPPGSVAHDNPYEALIYLSLFVILADGIFFYVSYEKYKDEKYKTTILPKEKISPETKSDNLRENFSNYDSPYLLINIPERTSHDFGLNFDSSKTFKKPNDPIIKIKYCDKSGRITERRIKIRHIQKYSNDYYITAYCYLRNEERVFKLSGIQELIMDGQICHSSRLLHSRIM